MVVPRSPFGTQHIGHPWQFGLLRKSPWLGQVLPRGQGTASLCWGSSVQPRVPFQRRRRGLMAFQLLFPPTASVSSTGVFEGDFQTDSQASPRTQTPSSRVCPSPKCVRNVSRGTVIQMGYKKDCHRPVLRGFQPRGRSELVTCRESRRNAVARAGESSHGERGGWERKKDCAAECACTPVWESGRNGDTCP